MNELNDDLSPLPEVGERETFDNLSLYSPEAELDILKHIAEKRHIPISIIPVIRNGHSLGYVIVPQDQARQRNIVAEAPLIFTDFDDTAAKTSSEKKRCWQMLESEGIPRDIIAKSDILSRIKFSEKSGAIYEPELDMRLLSWSKKQLSQGISADKVLAELDTRKTEYLQQMLTGVSFDEIEPVENQIKIIFGQTRYAVELYPDTIEVLATLRDEQG